ncbi:acyl-homoserine-lactone synthase [Ruegeria profundi]|uniref:acyl-homoserine-lactone synthase n=1 Tax=Ruegeria profundi TaxID=1685378 RepID=UPI001CD3F5F3|nr:acyl-homoserine-lactone synthase [Ruegeria profundi]MCA0928436.1 N-acyl-L-homoserine lactone synthetase [Ruegeria profundi]
MDRPLRYQQAYQSPETFPDLSPANDSVTAPKALAQRKHRAPQRALSTPRSKLGNIRATAMSFRNIHEHGTLLTKYLETRKSIFIDRLNWQICEADGMEFDQYDTPACQWIILHEFGEVFGGVRLLPSTAQCGVYSYMLRDAQRGILEGMPTDILFFEAPVKPTVWEASRFFVTDSVTASRRLLVQRELFHQMTVAAKRGGAKSILGIVPSVWARWSRRLGVYATPVGAKFSIDGTASQSVLFNIEN